MRNIYYVLIFIVFQGASTFAQNNTNSKKPVSFEFHVVNADLFYELFQGKADFNELFYQKTSEDYPENISDKYFLLQLYLRAGLPDKAKDVLEDIVNKYPQLSHSTALSLYNEISKFSYPQLVNIIIDSYGHTIVGRKSNCYYSGIKSFRCFYCTNFFRDLRDKKEWNLSQIEDWIQTNEYFPIMDKQYLKMMLYIDFKSEKEVQKLTEGLAQKMHEDKDDIEKLIEYLNIISIVRLKQFNRYNIDLSWIAKDVKPEFSTDAYRIVSSLGVLGYSDQAEYFFRMALSIELHEKDYTYLNQFRSRKLSKEVLRVSYLISLKESLSKYLLAKGEKEEAHSLMMESIELSKQNHIAPNMVFAGQTQRGTGIYKVEEELLEKEEVMVDSIEYWKDRHHYYIGREDLEKTENALCKGIDLLTLKHQRDTLHFVEDYQYFINNYCWILIQTDRRQQALDLFCRELAYSVESHWAARIISSIESDFNETELNPLKDVFWEYLNKKTYWNSDFVKLLIKSGNTQEKELIFNKLDSLAKDSVERSFNLANAIYDDYPEKSIPYFEFARLNYPDISYYDAQNREKCAKKLATIYMGLGEYKKAESVLLQMESKYIEWYVVPKLRDLALNNAKKGNYSESIRLWSVIQNINPSDVEYLYEMCENGMAQHLTDYYLKTANNIPGAINSERAIQEIKKIEKAQKNHLNLY